MLIDFFNNLYNGEDVELKINIGGLPLLVDQGSDSNNYSIQIQIKAFNQIDNEQNCLHLVQLRLCHLIVGIR